VASRLRDSMAGVLPWICCPHICFGTLTEAANPRRVQLENPDDLNLGIFWQQPRDSRVATSSWGSAQWPPACGIPWLGFHHGYAVPSYVSEPLTEAANPRRVQSENPDDLNLGFFWQQPRGSWVATSSWGSAQWPPTCGIPWLGSHHGYAVPAYFRNPHRGRKPAACAAGKP
jgi:hypothetical protein